MAPSIQELLVEDVEIVCRAPERFGRMHHDAGVPVQDIAEALVPMRRWEWLTADMISSALWREADFSLRDDRVKWIGTDHPLPADGVVACAPATVYYVGQEAAATALEARLPGQLLMYAGKDTALMVAAARSGHYGQTRIYALTGSQRAVAALAPLSNGAWLAASSNGWTAQREPVDLESSWMMDIHRRQCLAETLYLHDLSAQTVALKKLHSLVPPPEVERLLTPHLTHKDRIVRGNVLHALAMPACAVGFVPGEPLPPRDVRLEPAVLQPATVGAIVALALDEPDPGVLSWIVFALKSQTYRGGLRPLAPQVERVIRCCVLPRVAEPGVRDDAAALLTQLLALADQGPAAARGGLAPNTD